MRIQQRKLNLASYNSEWMRPIRQGTKCVLAAQVYLSVRLVGFTRVISFQMSCWSGAYCLITG